MHVWGVCGWRCGRGKDEQGTGGACMVVDSDMRGLVELVRWSETGAGANTLAQAQ